MMNLSKTFTQSKLGVACAGLLVLGASLPSHARDSDRITQLEKQVQELQLRVSQLEAQRTTSSNPAPAAAVASTRAAATQPMPAARKADAQVLAKWQSLQRGMTPDAVKGILGAPQKVISNSAFTYWDYTDNASVTFHHGRLNGWSEPN